MYTSLAQIAGGLFGIATAYTMYYFVERRERQLELIEHNRYQEEISKQKERLRRNK